MNNRIKGDLKFLLILFAILAAYLLFKIVNTPPIEGSINSDIPESTSTVIPSTATNKETTPQTTENPSRLDYLKDCGRASGKLFSVDSDGDESGRVVLEGMLEIISTPHPYIENVSQDNVFFVFANDTQQNFYSFYKEYSEKNTKFFIQTMDENVYFRIGILEDGIISSTAEISLDSKKKLINATKLNEKVKLKITISDNVPLPLGLPANFTLACHIEVTD